jgi:transposase
MAQNFYPIDREQMFLMPPSLRDWVPDDDPVWFVIEAVERMDLTAFYEDYNAEGVGGKAYHPSMMVSLMLYAYCHGKRSSREIEKLCIRDVAFRIVASNQTPDHASIARFRKRHEGPLGGMLVEVLTQVKQAGLLRIGVTALDGFKVKANASLEANRTEEGLEAEVRRMLKEAEAVDAEEDRLYGPGRPDQLPEGLRTRRERLDRLKAAKEVIAREKAEAVKEQEEKLARREADEEESGRKKRGRKPKDPKDCEPKDPKANATDPESRIMKTRSGTVQGYNAQVVVTEDQFIVAAELTQDANDVKQLKPMVREAQENLAAVGVDEKIDALTADAGYWSRANMEGCRQDDPDLFVATTKDWKQRKALREKPAPRGRMPDSLSPRDRMERKLLTKRGRQTYSIRGKTVEPAIGQVKHVTGLTQFMRRGKAACNSELKLTAAAHNLLKLWRRKAEKGWKRGQEWLSASRQTLSQHAGAPLSRPIGPLLA